MLQKGASIALQIVGEESPRYSTTLNNLGMLLTEMGDYAEAEKILKSSIEITASILGEQHLDLAPKLNNLAQLYVSSGREREAVRFQWAVAELSN